MKYLLSLLKILSSRYLTIALITAAAISMGVITVFEAVDNTGEVPYRLYLSWWFVTLLWLVFLNMACNAVKPYWWNLKKLPSIIMHIGFLLILTGGFFTWTIGIRGNLSISEGQTKDSFLMRNPVLYVTHAGTSESKTEVKKIVHIIPISKAGFLMSRTFLQALNPFTSKTSCSLEDGETVRIMQFHPSVLLFATVKNNNKDKNAVVNQDKNKHAVIDLTLGGLSPGNLSIQPGKWMNVSHEIVNRIVYEIVSQELDKSILSKKAFSPWIEINTPGKTTPIIIPVSFPGDVGKEFNRGGFSVKVLQYYPDYKMGQEPSPTDKPLNPALKLHVKGPSGEKTLFTFAFYPDFHGNLLDNGTKILFTRSDPEKTLILLEEKNNRFQAQLGKEGQLLSFSPGHPLIINDKSGRSPFVLKVGFERSGNSAWLSSGNGEITSKDGKTTVFLNNYFPLGFKIKLIDAVAKTWPASHIPKAYYSIVKIKDGGEAFSKDKKIETNYPFYKNGFRIYQSNMGEKAVSSGFSVLKDPGFPLVATGFFTLFSGLILLFSIRFVIKPLKKMHSKRREKS